jgi:LysR family transcriptional regulator, low CO2-responsive transcriptional regulator
VSRQGHSIQVITAGGDAAVAALSAGRADVAVVGYDPPPRRFEVREIAAYPQVLMISERHRLAGRDRVGLARPNQ